jgi:hypothetical protein
MSCYRMSTNTYGKIKIINGKNTKMWFYLKILSMWFKKMDIHSLKTFPYKLTSKGKNNNFVKEDLTSP